MSEAHAERAALPKRGSTPVVPDARRVASAVSPEDAARTSAALRDIRGRIDWKNVKGLLAASRDGLLLCSDTRDIEDDSVAAMAASAVGLAVQFTGRAGVGAPRAAIFEGAYGHVGVFTTKEGILLVVLGERDTTMGLFNVAARQALSLFQEAVADRRVRSVRDIAPADGNR
ncbi:roadblock/LC7 domain-containing protein [Amycolatopsis vancoresmycina]|uniref:Roadblock/LC7 family protein n=1 Tax=Amycolatopsis vancoresmycina DSM 44592 TaxID=1292037 RepID=R1FUH6_9PSEU|nr:roadblock/LC7 domain-containing protein [Amycolatopsis vancoresmycina]EOD63062.1 roadblock/LC7 family protein [Amycolatopsis vancoresmycina DSM 44592]